jgi:hypothetical protein
MVVGSALVALLLIAGWSLPELPSSFSDRPEIIERAAIRIRSEHKWPEKVVLDTAQPTFSSLPIEVEPNQQTVNPLPDEMTNQTITVAMARQNPDVQPIAAHRAPLRTKRKARRPLSAHVTRIRNNNEQPLGTGQECCRFEWGSTPATSKASSSRRVARRNA